MSYNPNIYTSSPTRVDQVPFSNLSPYRPSFGAQPLVQSVVQPVQQYVQPVQQYVQPVQQYVQPVQQYVQPVQEFVQPIVQAPQSIRGESRIGMKIYFLKKILKLKYFYLNRTSSL